MLSSINLVIATVRINIQAVTAYRRDRFIFIALFDPAVSPRLANLKHFQRRNLQLLSATGGTWSGTLPQKTVTDITVTALYLSLCLTPPFHYSTNSSCNSKGGIVSGDSPQSLSRCRLLQRKYQRIADPMRKHRHNAPLYCPYIRLQESYLPSFRHLYRRQ